MGQIFTTVALKQWARKDPYTIECRNMYDVIRETERAVLVVPVDYYGDEPVRFWAAKSAITCVICERGFYEEC